MNFKSLLVAMFVAALGAGSMGCSSACDDLKSCCQDAGGGAACDAYDDADEDACEAAKDLYAGYCD